MSEEKVNVQIDTEWIFLSVLLVLAFIFAGKGVNLPTTNIFSKLRTTIKWRIFQNEWTVREYNTNNRR